MIKTILLAVVMVIWTAIMWAGLVHVFMRGWGSYIRSKKQKQIKVAAKITNKHGEQEMNPYNWNPEFTRKLLVFECEDGVLRDYDVHDDIWDFVEVGDDGTLIYQGDLFIGFESRRPRHNMDKIYKNLTRG